MAYAPLDLRQFILQELKVRQCGRNADDISRVVFLPVARLVRFDEALAEAPIGEGFYVRKKFLVLAIGATCTRLGARERRAAAYKFRKQDRTTVTATAALVQDARGASNARTGARRVVNQVHYGAVFIT